MTARDFHAVGFVASPEGVAWASSSVYSTDPANVYSHGGMVPLAGLPSLLRGAPFLGLRAPIVTVGVYGDEPAARAIGRLVEKRFLGAVTYAARPRDWRELATFTEAPSLSHVREAVEVAGMAREGMTLAEVDAAAIVMAIFVTPPERVAS